MTATALRVLGQVPGPQGHPLWGMGQAMLRDVLGTVMAGFREYGDVVAYRFGPSRGPLRQFAVAVHHPDQVHDVLTGSAFGRDTAALNVAAEVVGRGLLTSDGQMWLRQRRTLQPLFTPRRVAGYAALMAEESNRVIEESELAQGAVVDLHLLMLRYTLRVVGRALFGDDVEDAIPVLHRLAPVTSDLIFARALQFVRPPLAWPTPRNRRLARARSRQYRLVDNILARRDDSPHDEADDLVTRLRAARDPHTGEPLSAREISEQVLTFLLAGFETTAGALSFTLHQLGRHPEIQDRVAEEALGCGDASRLPLARAAVLEGMRLFPPAYLVQRTTTEDVQIAGYPVPAKTQIFVSPWVTHRHPEFWPDPERFDPTRFVGDHDRPRYAYLPFGGGPRRCIGEHFALLEATVLLQAFLASYRIDALDANPAVAPLVTLRPATAIRARLTPR